MREYFMPLIALIWQVKGCEIPKEKMTFVNPFELKMLK